MVMLEGGEKETEPLCSQHAFYHIITERWLLRSSQCQEERKPTKESWTTSRVFKSDNKKG